MTVFNDNAISADGLMPHKHAVPNWKRADRFRFVAVGLPAAAATLGLFWAMQKAIQVDQVSLPTAEAHRLVRIALPEIRDTAPNHSREPARLLEANQPPPPPKYSARKSVDTTPTQPIEWTAPEPDFTRSFANFVPEPIVISERRAEPIAPPVVTYPNTAITRGLEGDCEVTFDVSAKGQPFNVQPVCTHSVFEREAKRAIQNVSFMPRIRRGQAVERRGVVYPLEFRLSQ
ncbi:MAG: TonB family protein [Henriciella sp.]|nr:TonB family protein [Henriciella sp.]